MKKLIITICLTIITLAAWAQRPLSFHAKAGIGTSYFYGKHMDSETKIAYKAGIGAEYAFNRTWVLQSALEFVSIGAKNEIEYVGMADMNELYLQLPIMIAARLNFGKYNHATLSVGPYVAVGVGGKTTGEQYNSSSSSTAGGYKFKLDTFGSIADNNMGNNRFDAGIAIGLTFDFRRFIIGAEAQVGLVTTNQQLNQLIYSSAGYNNTYLPKNFASFFKVGYRFW